ncbi:uncharacterized protein LOC106872680 [Octopus bimaculoides]|uniref:uncharacterized protein LOC106872680 n=1 Tax=Octopus bimaculoides TaxID=37653 RepID=UPI00071DB568|nr:uncharacterized protein LOC106872680 [Octopus bimaculoides]|eukprot:XP_014775241.1 PREDICTED: uncharacterized protein LOC106872680 [Octopus bimaculoides]
MYGIVKHPASANHIFLQAHNDKEAMKEASKTFYTSLLKSLMKSDTPPTQMSEVPPIVLSEIENAIKLMKADKTPWKDGMTTEVFSRGEELWKILVLCFNHHLKENQIPLPWEELHTILFHKKGDKEDLRNYNSKLFTRVIVSRLLKYLTD